MLYFIKSYKDTLIIYNHARFGSISCAENQMVQLVAEREAEEVKYFPVNSWKDSRNVRRIHLGLKTLTNCFNSEALVDLYRPWM